MITITCPSTDTLLPKYDIFVEPSLRFTKRVFGWMLDKDHELYTRYDRSFLHITLSNFLRDIENYALCQGIKIPDTKAALNLKKHVISKIFSFSEYTVNSNSRVAVYEYFRSSNPNQYGGGGAIRPHPPSFFNNFFLTPVRFRTRI